MLALRALVVGAGTFSAGPLEWSLPAGACGALTGPAGAGKSTVLETIAGVRPPQRGAVLLGDRDLATVPPERRGIGYVPQASLLFEHLSVRDNIAYGAASEAAVTEAVALARCQPLLASPVRGLSGGERQQVALARALASAPTLLLLDEPFAAMDAALQAQVRDAVLARMAATGTTVVLVTHDDRDLAGVAHRLPLTGHR